MGRKRPADDQELLMAVTLMTDAIDGGDGAVVAVAGAVINLSSILALINHSFPVGIAAVVN